MHTYVGDPEILMKELQLARKRAHTIAGYMPETSLDRSIGLYNDYFPITPPITPPATPASARMTHSYSSRGTLPPLPSDFNNFVDILF